MFQVIIKNKMFNNAGRLKVLISHFFIITTKDDTSRTVQNRFYKILQRLFLIWIELGTTSGESVFFFTSKADL